MGGFHIAMNFLGAIGHLMKETGIEDILVESGICQPGTVNKLLDGKNYYAMLHHTVFARAMFGLLGESFESSTIEEGSGTDEFSNVSTYLGDLCSAINENRYEDARTLYRENEAMVDRMRRRSDQFMKMNLDSSTNKLWMMYLDMIGILKRFIAVERCGN